MGQLTPDTLVDGRYTHSDVSRVQWHGMSDFTKESVCIILPDNVETSPVVNRLPLQELITKLKELHT